MAPDEVTEHVVRLREDAAGWRRVDGPRLTPDDPYLVGLEEAAAEALVGSQWALEHATVEEAKAHYFGADVMPFDPADYSVEELREELAGGDYAEAELDALYEAEADGDDRTTALDAIEAAQSGGDDDEDDAEDAEAEAEAEEDEVDGGE